MDIIREKISTLLDKIKNDIKCIRECPDDALHKVNLIERKVQRIHKILDELK